MRNPKSLMKSGIFYMLSSSIQKGLGFIVFMYLASILTIEEYAQFGLDYSLLTILTALSFAGIYESQVSSYTEYQKKGESDKLFNAGNTVMLISSAVSLFLCFIFYFFWHGSHYLLEFFYIGVGGVLLSFFNYQAIIIRLRDKPLISIIFSFVPVVASYGIGFVFVFIYKNSSSYFLGSLIGVFISGMLLIPTLIRNKVYFLWDLKVLKSISQKLFPYIIITLLMWFSGYGNTYVIKFLFNSADVATFVFLFTLSSILQLVANSMNQVWVPKFYNDYTSKSIDELERNYRKYTMLLGAVVGTVGLAIILILPYIITIFPDFKKFSNSSSELFYLFAGYVVSIPWWHCQNYYMINNRGKSLMKISLYSFTLGYALWIISMYFFGEIGIYIGFFIQMLVRTIFIYYKANKEFNVRSDWEGIGIGIFMLLLSIFIIKYIY